MSSFDGWVSYLHSPYAARYEILPQLDLIRKDYASITADFTSLLGEIRMFQVTRRCRLLRTAARVDHAVCLLSRTSQESKQFITPEMLERVFNVVLRSVR